MGKGSCSGWMVHSVISVISLIYCVWDTCGAHNTKCCITFHTQNTEICIFWLPKNLFQHFWLVSYHMCTTEQRIHRTNSWGFNYNMLQSFYPSFVLCIFLQILRKRLTNSSDFNVLKWQTGHCIGLWFCAMFHSLLIIRYLSLSLYFSIHRFTYI